jgi:hypothetical protein
MSARSKFNKKPAQEIEAAEVESTEAVQIEATENTEIESPVEAASPAEVANDEDHPGDPEIFPDSAVQTDEPISEVMAEVNEAEVPQAGVNDPVTTDPEPESAPNEGHDGTTTADTAPVGTSPVSQGTDAPVAPTSGRDPRLPAVGSVISRKYKDRDLNVTVLESGFEFEGHTYKSLSKLAGIISGQVCNGFAFFRLTGTGAAAPKAPKAARQAVKPSGDKLADKIAKIDGLVAKLRAALAEGTAALAEAESKRAEIVRTGEPAAEQAE